MFRIQTLETSFLVLLIIIPALGALLIKLLWGLHIPCHIFLSRFF